MRRYVLVSSAVLLALMGTVSAVGRAGSEAPASAEPPSMMTGHEAPMLSEMVAAGELPPIEDRLLQTPKVVSVVDSIGQYGGTLYGAGVGFLGVRDTRQMLGMEKMLYLGEDGVEPGYVESYEMSPDATVLAFNFIDDGLRDAADPYKWT